MEAEVIKIIDSKTAIVSIVRSYIHPLYKKVVRRKNKVMCHICDGVDVKERMIVKVVNSRPYSKNKKHCIVVE